MGGLTATVLLTLILWGHDDHRASYDQNVYHLPTIRQFAAELPRPDLSNYLSATTPGYHLILATVARVGGLVDRVTALKLVGVLFTVGLLATTAYAVGRRRGAAQAVVLTLPLLCSLYVISSGVWLLPDNAAWWGVAGVMTIALGGWRGMRTAFCGGALLLATVLMRQSHLWCAAPLWAAAAFATDDAMPRGRRVGLMALSTLPAFVVTGFFLWLWGGPTPLAVREVLRGGNPAAPAMVLSLIGVATPFFAGYLIAGLRSNSSTRTAIFAGAALGLVIGLAPRTSYDMAAGRWSGVWNATKYLPVIAGRSPLIVLLSCAGGAALGAWFAALPRITARVFLVAWVAFMGAQFPNLMAFQRYYEPLVLIAFALAAAHIRTGEDNDRPAAGARVAGPLLLSALLAGITVFTLTRHDNGPDVPSDNAVQAAVTLTQP